MRKLLLACAVGAGGLLVVGPLSLAGAPRMSWPKAYVGTLSARQAHETQGVEPFTNNAIHEQREESFDGPVTFHLVKSYSRNGRVGALYVSKSALVKFAMTGFLDEGPSHHCDYSSTDNIGAHGAIQIEIGGGRIRFRTPRYSGATNVRVHERCTPEIPGDPPVDHFKSEDLGAPLPAFYPKTVKGKMPPRSFRGHFSTDRSPFPPPTSGSARWHYDVSWSFHAAK